MKKLLSIFLLLSTISCNLDLDNQISYASVIPKIKLKDTIKIAFLGDSFCAGGNASSTDSFWTHRITAEYAKQYSVVVPYYLCTGGETTYKGLPYGSYFPVGQDFYSKPDSNRNITKVLSVLGAESSTSERLCFLEYSGNDLWIGNPQDSLRKNLQYLIGVLQENKINFVVSGISPRQQSGASGNLLSAAYYTGADSMNAWLQLIYPNNYGNIWDSLLRISPASPYGKMKVEYLSADSVHPNDVGHRYQYQGMINNDINDKLLWNSKTYGVAFYMNKIGDSLSVSSDIIGYKMIISGSNDYSIFTPIITYRNLSGTYTKRILGNAYLWYKVEIYGTNVLKTYTKKIN